MKKNFLDSDGGLATVSSKAATGLVKTLATSFDYSATGIRILENDARQRTLGDRSV